MIKHKMHVLCTSFTILYLSKRNLKVIMFRRSAFSGKNKCMCSCSEKGQAKFHSRLCTPKHTQNTGIGLGALVWQPQPSFSISDRSYLVTKKSRTECEQKCKTEDEGRMGVALRKREQGKREDKEWPNVAKQERLSDATNLKSKTWCEQSRQNAACTTRTEGHEEIIK